LILDTPLTKYTPDRIIQGDARLDLITARRVLSHTTGFQNWRSAKYKAMAAASVQKQSGFIIMTNGDAGYDDIIAKVVMSEPMQRFLPTALV